jgi:hypothetical protein
MSKPLCPVCGNPTYGIRTMTAIAIEAQRAVTVKQGAVRSTKARAEGIAQQPPNEYPHP